MAAINIDWDTLRRAKITQADFGAVIGVSRVTVSGWVNGGGMNPLRLTKVQKAMDALDKAVAEGELPLATIKDDAARQLAIKKVLYAQLTTKI